MNDTTALFEELETILTKEYEANEGLLGSASSVQNAIKKNDINAIVKHNTELDKQIFQVQEIEERRAECCDRLSKAIGIAKPTRLATLIEKAPSMVLQKLKKLHAALKNVLAELARITLSNRILIEEGLHMIEGRFAIILQAGQRFNQYQQKGSRAAVKLPCNPIFNRTV